MFTPYNEQFLAVWLAHATLTEAHPVLDTSGKSDNVRSRMSSADWVGLVSAMTSMSGDKVYTLTPAGEDLVATARAAGWEPPTASDPREECTECGGRGMIEMFTSVDECEACGGRGTVERSYRSEYTVERPTERAVRDELMERKAYRRGITESLRAKFGRPPRLSEWQPYTPTSDDTADASATVSMGTRGRYRLDAVRGQDGSIAWSATPVAHETSEPDPCPPGVGE